MCLPVAQFCASGGDDLSNSCSKWRSWNETFPAPPPPPLALVPVWLTPQENDSTSIQSLCGLVLALAVDPVEFEEHVAQP